MMLVGDEDDSSVAVMVQPAMPLDVVQTAFSGQQ